MSTSRNLVSVDPATAVELYRRMTRVRLIEESIAERYPDGKMRCPTHLSVGQEAPAAVVGMLLSADDLCVSTHRAHAHYLGKGGDLNRLIAELHGKETGCSRGKGGSMHLVDRSVGFIGSTAIVSSTIPVGTGLGLGLQLKNQTAIACVFLGDGATEEGVFFESINFAAVRQLPVLFVCENNRYSVYSSLAARQPKERKIHELVAAIGVGSSHCAGNDVDGLWQAVADAANHVRTQRKPAFIEIATYRWREHCGPYYDDDLGYRSPDEIAYWHAHDALGIYALKLLDDGILDAVEIDAMNRAIMEEIEAAFRFAENSNYPDKSALFEHVYADSNDELIPWQDN